MHAVELKEMRSGLWAALQLIDVHNGKIVTAPSRAKGQPTDAPESVDTNTCHMTSYSRG